MKDILRGIRVSALSRIKRCPDPIDQALTFFESGVTKDLNTAAVLGPVSLPKPKPLGEKPQPVIRVAEGQFANLSPSVRQRRRGLLGREATVVLFANPAPSPTQGEPVSAWTTPIMKQLSVKSYVMPDTIVLADLSNSVTPEENIRRIAASAGEQILVHFPTQSVNAYRRDANGSLL